MGVKVASIIPDPGDFNYAKKGDIYDPYCRDLILGAGGQISDWKTEENTDNDLIIRGLGGTSQKALKQCMDIKRTFYALILGTYNRVKEKNIIELQKMHYKIQVLLKTEHPTECEILDGNIESLLMAAMY